MSMRVATLVLLAAIALFGQYGTGTLIGTVTDLSGAAVPGASITLTNVKTNAKRAFVADDEGSYQFPALPSGVYRLTAQAPAFKTSTIPELILQVNSQVRADVVLEVGAVQQEIQVTAVAPQLQAGTAMVGTVISSKTILELPLNRRSFFDLVALSPATVKTLTGGAHVNEGRSIEIGGGRTSSTNYMLDGVDFSAVNVNDAVIALSLDVVEEFKVRMNFMDASYGHGAAGIEMISKTGSNSLHGVLYEFVRNREFQAGQFFRPAAGAPRFTYNQFGTGIGGPIRKDRTRLLQNSGVRTSILTAEGRRLAAERTLSRMPSR